MLSHQSILVTALAWAPTIASAAPAAGLLGPAFAAPTRLAAEPSIRAAAANVTALLEELFRTGTSPWGSLHANDTALSVQVLSVDGTQIVDYHYSPGNLNVSAGSAARVGADTVYRVGSISKLFTAYALLVNQGRRWWDKPVSGILPELEGQWEERGDGAQTRWGEVTVGALASQMGGVSAGYKCAHSTQDMASFPMFGAAVGLPRLQPDEIPKCSNDPTQPTCTREQFFRGYLKQHAVQAPYTTAIYSNAGYHLLGYVVEALTNLSFADALQRTVLDPLSLNHSGATLPAKKGTGVIPQGEPGWDLPMGDDVRTGGIYASTRDLGEFGRAILSHAQLSPLETRRWMKPHAHTALWSTSVGAPWEILRTRTRTTTGHAVDLYTKSGSVVAYSSMLILIPDYGIAVPILAAGSDSATAVGVAVERVVQGILPGLETAARQQAAVSLGGTYSAAGAASGNSTLVLAAGDDGMLIDKWVSNGVDTPAGLGLYAQSSGRTLRRLSLVPMGLEEKEEAEEEEGGQRRVYYRALIETTLDGVDGAVPRVDDLNDVAWNLLDAYQWGGIGIDEFVFMLGEDGKATAVSPRAMRETYKRR
ncbi:Beta-lactamase/transpeptidase-like protein [Beauveria brongniartii RCEF 3172]|uniref:Beta-lactamase/transpeptidase-like protein n=1 Tax=Beauveria brongniartii RCEF 3172 TaxID=1081107 RepID=A0A162M8H1_9HYPO|nr:Beta-lactamase/transpeptidase-like protein [Beauveria brongniartii RCEF 3172]